MPSRAVNPAPGMILKTVARKLGLPLGVVRAMFGYLETAGKGHQPVMTDSIREKVIRGLRGTVRQETLNFAGQLADRAYESMWSQMVDSALNSIGDRLGEAIAQGKRPADIGAELAEVTQLNRPQAAALEKRRRYWESLGLPQHEVKERVDAEFERQLEKRRRVIAHTEGRRITSDARDKEAEIRGAVWKVWLSVGDDRVGEDHEENEAAGPILRTESFPSGDMHPPGRPNCRCTLSYARNEQTKDLMEDQIKKRRETKVPAEANRDKKQPEDAPDEDQKTNWEWRQEKKQVRDEVPDKLSQGELADIVDETYVDKGDYPTYQKYDKTDDVKYRIENNLSVTPRFKSMQDRREFAQSTKELELEAQRLGIPNVRHLEGDAKEDFIMAMGDGALHINPTVFEKNQQPKRVPFHKNAEDGVWGISDHFEGKERTRAIMYHEFAHHIDQYLGGPSPGSSLEEVRIGKSKLRERILEEHGHYDRVDPSRYSREGASPSHEWFAENYSLDKMGRTDKTCPRYRKLKEEFDL